MSTPGSLPLGVDPSAAFINTMFEVDGFTWFIPLVLLAVTMTVRGWWLRAKVSKPTEMAIYTVSIPLEITACALFLAYNTVPSFTMLFRPITTELQFLEYVSTYISKSLQIGYLTIMPFLYSYIIELSLRHDTINWQLKTHHYTTIILGAVGTCSIRHNRGDPVAQLTVWDSMVIMTQFAAWDFMPHIALLARRLNDGYHTKYLTPAFGWRYWCKQVEHAFELLSVSVVPLVRTAIVAECALYYYQLYTKMGHLIVRPNYLIASWVAVHCLLLALLFFTQMVGTRVIYKFMYLKSKQEQRLAKAELQNQASEKAADIALAVGDDVTLSTAISTLVKAAAVQQGDAKDMLKQSNNLHNVTALHRDDSPSVLYVQENQSYISSEKTLEAMVSTWTHPAAHTPVEEMRANDMIRRVSSSSTANQLHSSTSSSLPDRAVSYYA